MCGVLVLRVVVCACVLRCVCVCMPSCFQWAWKFFYSGELAFAAFYSRIEGTKPRCYYVMRAGNPTAQSRNPHPHTPAALSFVPLFAGPGNLPGSDWDLRSLREHRATLALDSGLPAWLVFLPFINCPAATSAPSFPLSFLSSWQVASWILGSCGLVGFAVFLDFDPAFVTC